MRAIVAHSSDRLEWQEVPDVSPAAGEVVVEVSAAGVNRADLLQAAGKYPPPPGASEILGLEVSGTIAEVGDHVDRWQIGQTVCALLAGGGYAEFVAVPEGQLMPLPEGVELGYIRRPPRASPGEGYAVAHTKEQERIVLTALMGRADPA
jgi:NADPH:quinone reductase-like Zn-dependent oxidoreductase